MRMSRWRPVCPECGYSLRRLTEPRCPECGEPFPTTQKTFRRWAVRRLPWDRTHRSPLVFTYLKTLLLILFCPWKAGRGLAVPDRMGRAVRWAIAHVLVIAVCGTLLGTDQYYLDWARDRITKPVPTHPVRYDDQLAPADRVVVWALQSFAAWVVLLGALIALAWFVGWLLPCLHQAASGGAIKWSLYCVPGCLLLFAVWYTYYTKNPPMLTGLIRGRLPPPVIPADLLAAFYVFWWVAGALHNPYARLRGIRSLLLGGVLYMACWLLLTRLLFPVGPLGRLL